MLPLPMTHAGSRAAWLPPGDQECGGSGHTGIDCQGGSGVGGAHVGGAQTGGRAGTAGFLLLPVKLFLLWGFRFSD